MAKIDNIITESINKLVDTIVESKKNTKHKDSIKTHAAKHASHAANRIAKLLGHHALDTSEEGKQKAKKANKTKHYQSKVSNKSDKDNLKRKNVGGGRWITYNYHDYQRDNAESTEGDKSSIINTIDLDLADLAAVARKVFPTHTDEGAQSQLRKILNNERPMTKKVEHKLNQMISAGEIPTK